MNAFLDASGLFRVLCVYAYGNCPRRANYNAMSRRVIVHNVLFGRSLDAHSQCWQQAGAKDTNTTLAAKHKNTVMRRVGRICRPLPGAPTRVIAFAY